MVHTVVILTNAPDGPVVSALPASLTVIAADGGAEHARRLGLDIDLVVGDLDSVSAETLEGIRRIDRHDAHKDATDLELALEAALTFRPERIVVLGGEAGRLDHLIGGLLLLASDSYAGVRIDAQIGSAAVHVIRNERTISGQVGELISLFAVGGQAAGVVTEGLTYPLRGEVLASGSSRGTSNVFAASEASIRLEDGVLLAVRPTGSAMAGS